MFRLPRRLPLILCACLIAWFVHQPEGHAAAAGQLAISATPSADPNDPLEKWFVEQDQLMETLLMRLARIEILVREIHQLIAALPDTASSPAVAPGAPPAPGNDTEVGLLYIALGLLLVMSVGLVIRRQRLGQAADAGSNVAESKEPTESPSSMTGPAAAPQFAKTHSISPPHGNADQALELAEIMLTMGLGQGAAQTLIEQIRLEPKQALQHWLKLLEIYRQGNQKEEFERFATELRQHFNICPTSWQPAPEGGSGTIENYEHIARNLCKLWRQPGCMDYIQTLLNDNRGGTRNGFPQAVAEELLLLSALLRNA